MSKWNPYCSECHGAGFPLPGRFPEQGEEKGCPECGVAYDPKTAQECPACTRCWPKEALKCPTCGAVLPLASIWVIPALHSSHADIGEEELVLFIEGHGPFGIQTDISFQQNLERIIGRCFSEERPSCILVGEHKDADIQSAVSRMPKNLTRRLWEEYLAHHG